MPMMKRLLTILWIPALLLFGGPSEGYAFDEASLKKLRAMNHCPKCDLSEANLRKADLKKADLSGVDLRGADLSGANLENVFLSGADLRGVKLDKAILCNTQMPWGKENKDCK